MKTTRLLPQRLLALFAAGWLLFDFPLLRLWFTDTTAFGLPLLPVALFGAWVLLIALLARLMETPPEAPAALPPQGGDASGPAEPVPRRPLGELPIAPTRDIG